MTDTKVGCYTDTYTYLFLSNLEIANHSCSQICKKTNHNYSKIYGKINIRSSIKTISTKVAFYCIFCIFAAFKYLHFVGLGLVAYRLSPRNDRPICSPT